MESNRYSSLDELPATAPSLDTLWITPLRALAKDTLKALQKPIDELEVPWTIGVRTGDSSQKDRSAIRRKMPTALLTTPESMSLMLTYKDARTTFTGINTIIIDEWHELLSSKRGSMTELVLARLRKWNPDITIWGLSATLGNIETALDALVGVSDKKRIIIKGREPKKTIIKPLLPDEVDRFPMHGHLGLKMLPKVVDKIKHSESTLVFTNTRNQTERWFGEILEYEPMLAGEIALHHGSLDKEKRIFVEEALRQGKMKCVVCTSSLDLGVDFSPVDQVIQIGSSKGVARMLQRSGRSGHRPGVESRLTFVPTNAFELIELEALKAAIRDKKIEPRIPFKKPLDLLCQHLITLALGEGFSREDVYEEITSAYSFRDLTLEELDWCINFITKGGESLTAYPEYRKVEYADGMYKVLSKRIAMRHRMSIGTISSESMVRVQILRGGRLGMVEEGFVAKLKKGDVFIFAGSALEYHSFRDMVLYVRRVKAEKGVVPQWVGGRMPLSTELSEYVRKQMSRHAKGKKDETSKTLEPILDIQRKWSVIPKENELLIEVLGLRKRFHYFIYPFEGYMANEGLASLIAHRLSQKQELTFSISVNDYGFELVSDTFLDIDEAIQGGLFSLSGIEEHILDSINAAELAKRKFRDIARIGGLIFQGYPGDRKTVRKVQASSGLLYDVFTKYEPDNLLLKQAYFETLERELEIERIKSALQRMQKSDIRFVRLKYPSPLGFPILATSLKNRLSTESVEKRLGKLLGQMEQAADEDVDVIV
ncbi:MAG: ligase-associated DNA damage response DEXH box helicase [Candidatus Kapaibacteriales bacterium]